MKIVQVLFVCLFFNTALRAEYGGFHFTLEIVTKAGKSIKAYNYVYEDYLSKDSLVSQSYLLRVLCYPTATADDTFHYFQERIDYTFQYPEDETNQKYKAYQLYQLVGMSKLEIQSISIIEQIPSAGGLGIFNELTLKDEVWFRKKVKRSEHFATNLCDYIINIHEETENTKKTIQLFNELNDQYKSEDISEQEFEVFLNQFEALLERFKGEKVVIVISCFC